MEQLKVVGGRASETVDVAEIMGALGRDARRAARLLAVADDSMRTRALEIAAAEIRARTADIVAANARDVAEAKAKGQNAAFIDRLILDEKRIEGVAAGVAAIAALPDPVGRIIASFERPNGLRIERVAVPLGVIGIIYESRPAVTADAGALCIKSGNAAILRGGSESFHSSAIIHQCLVARVQAEARVPVFAHLEGVNHVFVERTADRGKALDIVRNAKLRRTGVCGAAETLLVDRASPLHRDLVEMLLDAGCEVRGDAATVRLDPRVVPAVESDWATEYLDAIISVKLVDGLDAAIDHVETYGSRHTDCIVTEDPASAARFLREVDSAIVMHNASTQFADGGEFGFGGEIGIATGRLHARGPVGVEQLAIFKYRVHGDGQTRP